MIAWTLTSAGRTSTRCAVTGSAPTSRARSSVSATPDINSQTQKTTVWTGTSARSIPPSVVRLLSVLHMVRSVVVVVVVGVQLPRVVPSWGVHQHLGIVPVCLRPGISNHKLQGQLCGQRRVRSQSHHLRYDGTIKRTTTTSLLDHPVEITQQGYTHTQFSFNIGLFGPSFLMPPSSVVKLSLIHI